MLYSLKASSRTRLDLLLREKVPLLVGKEISNSKLRRLIVSGSVYVGGRQVRIPAFEVFPGSDVKVNIDEEKLFFERKPDDISFVLTEDDVLFEDDYLIVVSKPANLPTEETIVEGRPSLHSAVVRYLFERQRITAPNAKNPPYAGIMHRLDRGTSGAILFSKTRSVNKALQQMFACRDVKKKYAAVVCGVPVRKKFTVEFPMARISPRSQAAKWGRGPLEAGGQMSRTDFELVSVLEGNLSILDCCLHTGRTHQIRVHLSDSGLPILGDTLYGGRPYKRIMLHSLSLSFTHPVTKEDISVVSPLPEEFCLLKSRQEERCGEL